MSLFKKFVSTVQQDFKKHGMGGPPKTAVKSIRFFFDRTVREMRDAFHRLESENIYERDWDLLILLDCARVDMMKEVADEYDFIDIVGEHTSPGTSSGQWMHRTFTSKYRQEMEKTVYVTANTSSEAFLNSGQFLHLEEVWRDGWDEELGTIPAREVTDRAIHFARKYNAERIILHYMQPHLPFVNSDINANIVTPGGMEGVGLTLGELQEEGYSREELYGASVDNLRYVLNDVDLILSNINADRVVISADHGQAFGEQGVWGHPPHTYLDVLKSVPLCVTSASDSRTYQPEYDPEIETDISLEQKLAALGYK